MPNLLPLYLLYHRQQGLSVETLAAALDMPSRELELRLEAARLCFDHQCRVAVQSPVRAFDGSSLLA